MRAEKCESRMTRRLHCVKPLDSIRHARELMEQHRVNQLPVLVDGRLVGIVTDRDLRDAYPSVFESSQHRALHRSDGAAQLDHIPVEAVMTPHVVTLCPSDTLGEAARLMRRERIGAVPIVAGERVVGIITRSDLLDALVSFIDQL